MLALWVWGVIYLAKHLTRIMDIHEVKRDRVLEALVGKCLMSYRAAENLGMTYKELCGWVISLGLGRCRCCGVWDVEGKFVLDGNPSPICGLCYSSTTMAMDESDPFTRVESKSKTEVACDMFTRNMDRIRKKLENAEREVNVKYVNMDYDSFDWVVQQTLGWRHVREKRISVEDDGMTLHVGFSNGQKWELKAYRQKGQNDGDVRQNLLNMFLREIGDLARIGLAKIDEESKAHPGMVNFNGSWVKKENLTKTKNTKSNG
jgi:hypothetical protein